MKWILTGCAECDFQWCHLKRWWSSLLSVAMINTMIQNNLEGVKSLLQLILLGHKPSLWEVRDRNLEAETLKDCCLLTHFLVHAQLPFSYSLWVSTWVETVWPMVGLALLHQLETKIMPYRHAHKPNLNWSNSSIEVPSSQVTKVM